MLCSRFLRPPSGKPRRTLSRPPSGPSDGFRDLYAWTLRGSDSPSAHITMLVAAGNRLAGTIFICTGWVPKGFISESGYRPDFRHHPNSRQDAFVSNVMVRLPARGGGRDRQGSETSMRSCSPHGRRIRSRAEVTTGMLMMRLAPRSRRTPSLPKQVIEEPQAQAEA